MSCGDAGTDDGLALHPGYVNVAAAACVDDVPTWLLEPHPQTRLKRINNIE